MSLITSRCRPCQRGDGVKKQHCSNEPNSPIPVLQVLSRIVPGLVLGKTQTRVIPCDQTSSGEKGDRVGIDRDQVSPTDVAKYEHAWLLCGLGILASICLGWTIWLILLTIAPNEAVNHVMNTEAFDYGTFWLLVDTPPNLLWPTVLGLGVVGLGYAASIIQILSGRRSLSKVTSLPRPLGSFGVMRTKVAKVVVDLAVERTGSTNRIIASAAKLAVSLTQNESSTRKVVHVYLKLGDLIAETILLVQFLEEGTPLVLVIIYTMIVSASALSCVLLMFCPYERPGLTQMLVDVIFDFLVAVGYPMLVLIYCLSTFKFDYEKLAINLHVFPAGWFEQGANLMADPVQTAIIHKSLKLLRVSNVLDLSSRVGVNFIFCFRLYQVTKRTQNPENLCVKVYPRYHRFSGALIVAFVTLLIVFVEGSVRTSAAACQAHPECVVNPHRWTLLKSSSLTQCPCLTLIDGEIAPKTYGEWMHPKNVTDKLAQLAATGDLQTIQLINRYLPVLPDELRSCTKMMHMSLIYTHTKTIPAWFQKFEELQYLHVEGIVFSSLDSLPDGMFDNMRSLTYLHLGIHPQLKELPSFDGLTSVKSLTLALLFSLVELPSFNSLYHLERLVIISLVSIDSLPDLAPVKKFTTLGAVMDFSGGVTCKVHIVKCILYGVLDEFSGSVCGELILPGTAEEPPTEASMRQCDGDLYRQCKLPGHHEAMCYNARLMGIACSANPYAIEMRRQQIQQGVGGDCNPVYEAWLGCKVGHGGSN